MPLPPGSLPPLSLDFSSRAISGDPYANVKGVSLGNYSQGFGLVGWAVIGAVAIFAIKKLA